MSIVVDEGTKLAVSGLTGREGSFHGLRNKAYGTDLVAGVTPGKGGQDVEGVPVFDTIKEAVTEAGADTSMIFVPARFAAAAIDEAIDSGVGIVSNIDDKLLGISRRHLRTELDLVVTAQQVRSYKPDPVHFKECARRIGGKKGWLHIGADYTTDIAPVLKMNVPVIWVNRHGEKLEGRKAPSATVKNFREAVKKLGAS